MRQKNKKIVLLILIILIFMILFYIYYRSKNNIIEKFENSNNAMIIVEPRQHKHLEKVINNFDLRMDKTWDLYVFHGKSAEEFAKNATKNIKGRNVFLLPLDTDNLTADEYNKLFQEKIFWEKVNSENILVFQTDTALCANTDKYIYNFTKYNYIGCPYSYNSLENPWNVPYGVGGLSFRKKSFMIDCINNNPNSGLAEDVLFSKCMKESESKTKNKLNPLEMNNFCTQYNYNKEVKSFGAHNIMNLHTNRDDFLEFCPEAKFMLS